MSWTALLLTYLLGGITFVPLVLALVFAHFYFTSPYREDADPNPKKPSPSAADKDSIVQLGDEISALKAAQKDETKARINVSEPDVAAGYFAVCREYTPMGINAKPIERSTPVGSATVAAPSPSVYQTMYRSIFDRKPVPGPLDSGKNISQRPKKAGNVFYVVLRHGHLMLFDDDEQLEVRHVVSLAHHDVSLFSGEGETPEGELFIKRNAIRLTRKPDGAELGPDSQLSKPFFLFSENCSAKEDFYFALLRNQVNVASNSRGPTPLTFDVKNIISLVQKLHSSEEHMQTRWLNAMIGRVFLGIYKTKDLENFIRKLVTKKIARVKKPSFLSNIVIKNVDTGESGPYVMNPRLRDLTVEGDLGLEADVRYTGNFRLEVAATARIDLGTRFKAREVNLVLAVVVRKLEGHMLFKIKPPPSNRIWFSFQQMPKIEMTIEPIVSSRQITYTVILRQIENRIKEVIAETLVLPFWDDIAFFRTEGKRWRGGIFAEDPSGPAFTPEEMGAQPGDVDDFERQDDGQGPEIALPAMEKSQSMPVLEQQEKPATGLFGRKLNRKNTQNLNQASSASASTTSVDVTGTSTPQPRSARSTSFVNPPTPTLGTDATNADIFKPSSSPPNESPAAAAMAELTAKSRTPSLIPSPSPSQQSVPLANPYKPYITSKSSNNSSSSSREATDTEKDPEQTLPRRNTATSMDSVTENGPAASTSDLSNKGSVRSQTGSITRNLFVRRENTESASNSAPGSSGLQEQQKRTALAAVTNAAATAKRWGIGAIQRHNEAVAARNSQKAENDSRFDLNQPIGRGRPLPPPGQPLPMPDRRTKTAPIPVPKRKPVPPPQFPPQLPPRSPRVDQTEEPRPEHRPVPPPPLPRRRHALDEERPSDVTDADNVLVVEAPSEPTTPLSAVDPAYVQPWAEDVGDDVDDGENGPFSGAPIKAPSAPEINHESKEKTHRNSFEGFNFEEQSKEDKQQTDPAKNGTRDEVSALADAGTAGNLDGDDEDDEFSAWMDNPGPEEEPAPEVTAANEIFIHP